MCYNKCLENFIMFCSAQIQLIWSYNQNATHILNMRTETQDNIKIEAGIKGVPNVDIIQQTRKQVKGMNQQQRFRIAKQHLFNALDVKTPRLDIYSSCVPKLVRTFYHIQTSLVWRGFLLALSYILMYLVIWETEKPVGILITIQSIILFFLWADVILEVYHKSHEAVYLSSKFQMRFYVRLIVLLFVLIDLIIQFTVPTVPDLPVRPLLVSRCFLPLFYDSNIRKAFEALLLAYKDIFVLLFFYASVIVGFAIIANQIIQLPQDVQVDPFSDNYRELDKTIFIMYALSTYDAYPDNQLVAIRNRIWIYAFFICFIILNIFFFATIPPILVFNSFRETRSKIVLIDQIKQQHSLIMSFVSLGEENLNISQQKLIRFLLYVYKNKVRYVDHITNICRQLDENNNRIIHIKEYMHLCQVLQSKSSMLPPKFEDWNRWIKFRKVLNDIFKLKIIISSKKFKIFSGIFILFSFVNCLLSIYTRFDIFDLIDDILIAIFVFQVIVKIIALGIEGFFNSPWNKLDFFLISTGLILELIPKWLTPHNSDVLVKMTRIFRVTTLIKTISSKERLSISIYRKMTRLISQIAIIIPIVLKLLPIYMVTFYILGTTSIQIFRESNVQDHNSPYNTYEQFSNFKSFIFSQFLFMQILVESQWSTLAYDYAFKYKCFGLVMIFFVLSHALLVTIITSLIKGVTWEVYNSVHEEFNERMSMIMKAKVKEESLLKKKQNIDSIKARIDEREYQIPLNIISKELYENKIDELIFKKLKQNYENMKKHEIIPRKRRRSSMITYITQDYNLIVDQADQLESVGSRNQLVLKKQTQFVDVNDIEGDDDLQKEDIEEEMEKILNKIVISHKIEYSEVIIYPKVLTEYLQRKIKPLRTNFMDAFDIGDEQSECDDVQDIFVDGLSQLLNIEVSERQQKSKILKSMVREGIISQQQSEIALTKRYNHKDFSIDSDFIMRKAFLSDTNQKLIKKFQIEYFSNVYGKSFKQINKITLEPLLRLQSTIIYSLRNVLRYRKTREQKFFTIISTIQDMISNQLLKTGSLFKFVYQINSLSDIWFTIDLRQSYQLKIRFIKNGIWVYHKSMKNDEIMIGEDVFNCQNMPNGNNRINCEKYVKMMYESFESLAFCVNEQKFFKFNPIKHIYNLFTLCKEVENINRVQHRQVQISKIMLVILSKEDEREEKLSYNLSDLQIQEQEQIKGIPFRLGQSQNQTFKKLKQMELLDHQKIVQSQGMPFNYIANLMIEVQDLLRSYQHNFVFQLERFLNNKLKDPLARS